MKADQKTIFEKVKNKDDFSETERQILGYLFGHHRDIGALTIKELAAITYSSNATIIRMCQKLGFLASGILK